MRIRVFLLSCLLAGPALAAESGLDRLLSLSLDELSALPVSTPARTTQSWKDVHGTLYVVTAKDIHDRGYRHLADLLRDLPSVDMQGPYNTSSRLTVRGVTGNTKMLVLQDGVRIGAPAGELVPVSINFPLYMARQVEVMLTPGSALYGADAVSGVINIITRDPGSQVGQKQTLVYEGSESSYQHGHLLVNGRVGERALTAGAHTESFNNRRVAEEYPEIYRLGDLKDASGNVVIPAAARNAFQSAAESTSVWARMQLLPVLEAGAEYRAVRYPNDATTRPEFVNYGGVWGEHMFNAHARYRDSWRNGWDTNTLLGWSTWRLDTDSHFDNLFSNYQTGYKYAESSKLQLDSQWGYAWSDSHSLTAGLVAEHVQAIPRSTDLSQPYDPSRSPQDQPLYYPGTNNTLPVQLFRVEQDNYAVFAQDQRRWGERWSSQLGGRYDRNSDYGGRFSPFLGLRFERDSRLSFGLALSQAYLAPSPSYSYEHFGSFTGVQDGQGRYLANSFRIPNPGLQPEEIRAAELRVDWKPAANRHLSLTVYHSRLDNLILYAATDPVPDSDFIPGGFILSTNRNVNLGDSVATGAEVSGALRFPRASGSWEVWGAGSYTDGRLSGPGGDEPLPYTAPVKLKAGGTWRSVRGWFVSPSCYLSDRDRVPTSASKTESLETPGYGVMNLYAGWDDWWPGVSLLLRVENLGDRRYYHAGGTSKQSLIRLPQPGRTLTLGAEIRF
ncbi:MAG TPA: TonB-dependent receptor [Fluviicoccus sp.]|nr:TonB-dependent receptor [Fluviicoccus sp.]